MTENQVKKKRGELKLNLLNGAITVTVFLIAVVLTLIGVKWF